MSDELDRRLRDALHAYADQVDAPDDDVLPTTPAASRPGIRRWRGAILAAAAAAAVVTGSLWVLPDRDSGPDAGSAVSALDDTPAGAPASQAPASQATESQAQSGTSSDQALSGTGAVPAEGFSLPSSLQPGVAYPVDLYTHCGVRGIDVGGVWFAADPPLVESGGNPPAGWGNPDQRGTLTLQSAAEAVFADDAGHEVRLRADEAARPAPCD